MTLYSVYRLDFRKGKKSGLISPPIALEFPAELAASDWTEQRKAVESIKNDLVSIAAIRRSGR